MKKLIIFGTGKIAEVIFYYAATECKLDVAGFTVDTQFKSDESFLGLPVYPFEDIEKRFPPEEYDLFVAVGYHDLNALRARKCQEAWDKGYKLISVISPEARVPRNVTIGRNCFIMPPAIIHPCVTIEDNVFVWSGAIVGHHSVLKENAWLTSGCNVSGNVTIGTNTFLAINATIGHSVNIGNNCFIGANALVIKNLEDDQVCIAEADKPIKLTSQQFLKMSKFTSL